MNQHNNQQQDATKAPQRKEISFELYQIGSGKSAHLARFCNLDTLKHLNLEFDPQNYEKVYSGSVSATQSDGSKASTADVLESLFERFNLQHPADYRARSMSVSDVVVLHENGRDTAHFCDSIGFVEVPQFLHPAQAVTMETTGLAVDGHEGTWHTIESREIQGRSFFLMEHDTYGASVANVAVDDKGTLVAEDLWHGFTAGITRMITEEQGLAAEQKPAQQSQDATGRDCVAPTERNYLKAAEEYQEENYDCIDGRMSTQSKLTPGDDTERQPEQRPSVLGKLREKQAQVASQGAHPKPEVARGPKKNAEIE